LCPYSVMTDRGVMSNIVEVKPSAWVLPDRVGFADWLHKTFTYEDDAKIDEGGEGTGRTKLFPQQRFVRDFIQSDSPYAGLVLYHGVGVGKSCAAVAAIKALESNYKIVVMLPASLASNFYTEVRKCGGHAYAEDQRWSFSSSSSSGGQWRQSETGTEFAELDPEDREAIRVQLNHAIRSRMRFISYNGISAKKISEIVNSSTNMFDDAAVIIDEVHDFISQVTKQKNVSMLYAHMMAADPRKVVLLTGTPFMNSVQELPYLVNLAHGFVRFLELRVKPSDAKSSSKFRDHDSASVMRLLEERITDVLGRNHFVNRFRVKHVNDEKKGVMFTVVVQVVPNGFVTAEADVNDNVANAKDAAAGGRGKMFVRPYLGGASPFRAHGSGAWLDLVRKHVVKDLEQEGSVVECVAKNKLILPVGDAFLSQFTTHHGYMLKNENALAMRLAGTVSYFGVYDPELYPRLNDQNIVKCMMSARQFDEYKELRVEERRLEEVNAKFARSRGEATGAGRDDEVSVGKYRPLTRAVGNFVFPHDVSRPQKKEIAALAAADETVEKAYEDALRRSIETLRVNKPEVLRMDGKLAEHSPKMFSMLRHFEEHEKKALVYSAFRKMEGIGLLSACLDANGYSMLHVKRVPKGQQQRQNDKVRSNGAVRDAKKTHTHEYRVIEMTHAPSGGNSNGKTVERKRYMTYDNSDPVAAQIVLDIYNYNIEKVPPAARADIARIAGPDVHTNDRGEVVQLLLVTKSGAQGLNLKNVREVHALEPFWNSNIVDQVTGRAVRAGSHLSLPPEERTVDVFLYMSILNERQAEEITIKRRDGGISSDQHVYNITKKKDALVHQMQRVLQRGAVDCRLHRDKHARVDPGHGCLPDFANRKPSDFTYDMPYDDQVFDEDEDTVDRARAVNLVAAKADGVLVYIDRDSGKFYDYDRLKTNGEIMEITPPTSTGGGQRTARGRLVKK